MIQLELVPIREKSANGARLGRYAATMPDGRVVARSRQPLFDGARALVALGDPPETMIVARHQGSASIAMRSTVAEAAKWTIEERDGAGLRKALWIARPSIGGASETGHVADGRYSGAAGVAA